MRVIAPSYKIYSGISFGNKKAASKAIWNSEYSRDDWSTLPWAGAEPINSETIAFKEQAPYYTDRLLRCYVLKKSTIR
jgi:hypothetical protein